MDILKISPNKYSGKLYLRCIILFFRFSSFLTDKKQNLLRNRLKILLQSLKKQKYSNPELFNEMGNIYLKMYNYKMACYFFGRALEMVSDSDIFYSNLGFSLFYKDEHELAKRAFDKAIEINPKNSKSLLNRSFMEYIEKKYDLALFYCNKAIDVNNFNYKAYFDRGMIYLRYCKHELAIQDFTKCIKLNIIYLRAYKRRNEAKRLSIIHS